jgi:putative membrane protein
LEVAVMMYGGWGGGWWMMLMPLVWIALIGVIVWAAVRVAAPAGRTSSPADYGQPRRETPQEVLDRRFASGEIDADAYTRARDTLAGKRAGPS